MSLIVDFDTNWKPPNDNPPIPANGTGNGRRKWYELHLLMDEMLHKEGDSFKFCVVPHEKPHTAQVAAWDYGDSRGYRVTSERLGDSWIGVKRLANVDPNEPKKTRGTYDPFVLVCQTILDSEDISEGFEIGFRDIEKPESLRTQIHERTNNEQFKFKSRLSTDGKSLWLTKLSR